MCQSVKSFSLRPSHHIPRTRAPGQPVGGRREKQASTHGVWRLPKFQKTRGHPRPPPPTSVVRSLKTACGRSQLQTGPALPQRLCQWDSQEQQIGQGCSSVPTAGNRDRVLALIWETSGAGPWTLVRKEHRERKSLGAASLVGWRWSCQKCRNSGAHASRWLGGMTKGKGVDGRVADEQGRAGEDWQLPALC